MQCINNMKQIGLAINNYEQANNCYPPGGLPVLQATTNTIVSNASFSPHARLLQFAEQLPIYNTINFAYGCHNADTYGIAANSTSCMSTISMFLCPSDTPPSYNVVKSGNSTYRAPGNNYFASLGSTLEWDTGKTSGPPNGIFPYGGGPLGTRDVRDGSSNTIAFGEWRIGSGNNGVLTNGSDIVWANAYPPGVTRNTPNVNLPLANANNALLTWLSTCKTLQVPGSANLWVYQGETWAFSISTISQGSLCMPPNPKFPGCMVTGAGGVDGGGSFGLTSRHPGGANTVFCDGSVHFLKDSVNMNTLWALGSRDQGEVIDASSY